MLSLLWLLLFLTNEIVRFSKILEETYFDWTIEKQLIFSLVTIQLYIQIDTR